MMQRILEPELMDGELQSIAYAKADFSTSNQRYVDQLTADFPHHLRTVLDIGCGPADVLIRLARANPDIRITAIDGSDQMIKLAQQAVKAAGLVQQITLTQGYIPGLPFEEHSYDAILSKDLLHHLPDPSVLWQEAQRLGKSGAAIYVMDLYRPATPDDAMRIVEAVAANEDPILKQDFYNSLCAAFTVEEVKKQLRIAHLNLQVTQISDRHMLIKGIL
jgi:ubiquinone/menaquinone biosynthesis C-methylase UbiE